MIDNTLEVMKQEAYQKMNDRERLLIDQFPTGKNHAVTATQAQLFNGGVSRRDLSRFARRLMKDYGFPLLAGNTGFFQAGTISEAQEYVLEETWRMQEELSNLEYVLSFIKEYQMRNCKEDY